MSQSLRSNIDFIKQLAVCSTVERRKLLENASNKNIKALAELCLNLLRGNLPIDYKTKSKLKKHQKSIQLLARRRVPLKNKRELINQRGSAGFLLPLASLAVPMLANLTGHLVNKVFKK